MFVSQWFTLVRPGLLRYNHAFVYRLVLMSLLEVATDEVLSSGNSGDKLYKVSIVSDLFGCN